MSKKTRYQAMIATNPEQIFRGFTLEELEEAAKKEGWTPLFASRVLLCCARLICDIENHKQEIKKDIDFIGKLKRLLKGNP